MRQFVHLIVFLGLMLASACAPAATATATPIPPTPTPVPQPITFTTPDGVNVGGYLHGSGKTVVIFSVMGNCRRGWDEMADLVAQQDDVMALTYQWRACKESGTVVESELQKFVDDLRGAINYTRDMGAEKMVLVGASLGGVASARLAIETSPNGLVIVAAPRTIDEWGFEIGLGDVNIDMPKLFITAEQDSVVDPSRTRELFDLAAEPKAWQTYPGTAHGTDLFETESKEAMQQRILDFVLMIAARP